MNSLVKFKIYSVKTHHGKYLSIMSDGKLIQTNNLEIATRVRVVIDESENTAFFITPLGYYLSAQRNGTLQCNRTIIGPWEKFKLIPFEGENSYAFLTAHQFYLCAEVNDTLTANRKRVGPYEKFQLFDFFSLFNDGKKNCSKRANSVDDFQHKNALNRFKIAVLQERKEDIDAAIENYHLSIENYPNFFLSYYRLGKILTTIKKWEQGLDYYQKAIALKPDFCWLYYDTALVLEKMDRISEAVSVYLCAIEIDSYNSFFYAGLAKGFDLQGNLPLSVACYIHSVKLNPGFILKNQDVNEALYEYLKTVKEQPSLADITLYRKLGESLVRNGQYEKAIACFRHLIGINPYNLVEFQKLIDLKRVDEAVEKLKLHLIAQMYLLHFSYLPELEHQQLQQFDVSIDLSPDNVYGGIVGLHNQNKCKNISYTLMMRQSDCYNDGRITSVLSRAVFFHILMVNYVKDDCPKNKTATKKNIAIAWRDDYREHKYNRIKNKSLVFCVRKNDESKAFCVPDSYFISQRGYYQFRREVESEWLDWNQRKNTTFWRGSSSGSYMTEKQWQNNHRIRLCKIAQDYNDELFLDAKITNIVQFQNEKVKSLVEKSGLVSSYIPTIEFIKYKYVIDIDGNVNSWPGLFTKLLTGSCVLKIESEWKQWYYDRLKPWVNYVPVKNDMSDLIEKIDWCCQNDEQAKNIGESGRKLALSMTFKSELAKANKIIEQALNSPAN